MSLMTDATAFVDKLLRQPVDPRRCPHCGSTRAFDLAAKAGLNLEHITVFVSDGAAGFRAFLARCLNDGQQAPPWASPGRATRRQTRQHKIEPSLLTDVLTTAVRCAMIVSNRFDMAITIRDVARRAGASVSTVSYVLNGGPRSISAAMRARVQAAVAELGYQPNAIARSLKTRSTRMVGIVLPSTTSSFFTAALRGLLAVLQEHDYAALVCNSSEDQELERTLLIELNRRQVDGIVLTPARLAQQDTGYLMTFPAPIVIMDRGVGRSPADVVAIDNRAGVYEAVALLLNEGHRDIAFLAGPEGTDTAIARCQGYQAAYAALGLVPPEHLVRWLPFEEDAALAITRELLSLTTRPSAIVAGSTRLSVGALRAIAQAGLRIPHDIAVVAYGEVPWADLTVPPLTVVEQRVGELGQAAGRLLVNRLSDRDRPRQEVILQPRLVVRASHRRIVKTGG